MTPEALLVVMEETWPAAGQKGFGPLLIRDGQGGGKRVSAASIRGDWTARDLDQAETVMRDRGQAPLFQLLPDQQALDGEFCARGYALVDPVLGYTAPVASLAVPLPPWVTFPHWPPLEIVRDIWAEAGIGPGRVAVMGRAGGFKSVILARQDDRPAGVLFVAVSGGSAMIHALEVRLEARRKGVAAQLLHASATWAQAMGALDLCLVVTVANAPARALYAKLGMTEMAGYHYRELKV